jgi:hypothetical protein
LVLDQKILSTLPAEYGSSIEALRGLLQSCHITEMSSNLSHLSDGIEYSFVEITCDDGIQYGLQAYGKEALELYRVALENIFKEQKPPMFSYINKT